MRTQYVDTALPIGHVSIVDVTAAASWHSALAVSASPAPVTETWFHHTQFLVQERLRKIHPASSYYAHGTIVGRRECSVVGYIQPALAGCAASGPVVEDQLSVRHFSCFPCDAVRPAACSIRRFRQRTSSSCMGAACKISRGRNQGKTDLSDGIDFSFSLQILFQEHHGTSGRVHPWWHQ